MGVWEGVEPDALVEGELVLAETAAVGFIEEVAPPPAAGFWC